MALLPGGGYAVKAFSDKHGRMVTLEFILVASYEVPPPELLDLVPVIVVEEE